jgi:hypothetical protein
MANTLTTCSVISVKAIGSRDYGVKDLCALMGVSRAGYYKWLKHDKSPRNIKREELILLVEQVHLVHKSHGYRWTAAYIRIEHGYTFSDNYIYKCFRFLGILAIFKVFSKFILFCFYYILNIAK